MDKAINCKKRNLFTNMEEYTCELTESMDALLVGKNDHYYVYILNVSDSSEGDYQLFAIRVPGCTIGDLRVSKDKKIVKAVVGQSDICRFAGDVNELLAKFVGRTIEVG